MSLAEDTSPGRRQRSDTRITNMTGAGSSTSGADTVFIFFQDNTVYGPPTTSVNTPVPSACITRRLALNTATAGVTVAGNWQILLFRNNDYPVPTATFTFNPTTLNDTFVGEWSSAVRFEAGDTFWLAATGPTRNVILGRINYELEII